MNISRFARLFDNIEKDGVDCHTVAKEHGNGNAIEAESGLLLYSMVHRFNPTTVVETGTHWGFSSACIACGLHDLESAYPRGRRLHTIDSSAYDGKPELLWKSIGVDSMISHYIADSRTGEANLPPNTVIDFLYLDADHSAESVVAEWEQLAPMLSRHRALVAFHDTRLDPREADGIKQILAGNMAPLPDYKFVGWLPIRNYRGIDFLLLSNEQI
ncbi:MAG: class I SAM-dependent methyltransferase [Caulobacteraceae bacterium]|nr:class I SAM-dependent methyltransferase [Caulobacteraceae bacterium]